MIKKLTIAFLIFLLPQSLPAFEQAMLSMKVPTNLEVKDGEFRILHRFIGVFHDNTFKTAMGMTEGANVNFGIRYHIWSKLEANLSYLTRTKEIIAGASYAYLLPQAYLRSQLDAQFFTYDPGTGDRRNSYFGLLSLQSEPIFKRVAPVINLGYDGDNHRFGLGLGVSIILIKKFELIGEYYPVKRDEPGLGPKNSFAFGFKDNTAGHHFMLLFTNTWASEPRRMMLGTRARGSDLYFGFNIERWFNVDEFVPGGEG
ncbi:MAG: DUF5777 family beta-barrel protein [Proteobacteria bacterium]|nr:DUF5777 family beta-barrel protein [Pseudomonadota bacterium]